MGVGMWFCHIPLLQVTGADVWVTAVQGAHEAGLSGAPTPRAGRPTTPTATSKRSPKASGGASRSATGTWSCLSGRFRDGDPACPAVRLDPAWWRSTVCSAAAPAAFRSWTGVWWPLRSVSTWHRSHPWSRPAWCRAHGTALSQTSPPGPSVAGVAALACGTGPVPSLLLLSMGVPHAPTWQNRRPVLLPPVPWARRSTPTASRWDLGASAGCPAVRTPRWIWGRTLENWARRGWKATRHSTIPTWRRWATRPGRSAAWGATAGTPCWGKGASTSLLLFPFFHESPLCTA